MKTIIVVNRQNQEKNISHIRRFLVSQIRHLKTGSLIPRSPEGISQSRHLTPPVLVTFQLSYIIIKYRIYDNTLSQILKKWEWTLMEKKEETATRPSPNNMADPDT